MGSFYQLHIVPPPDSSAEAAQYGSIAFTDRAFYVSDGKKWMMIPFDFSPLKTFPWAFPTQKLEGLATLDNQNFYLYSNGSWKSFAIFPIDPRITDKNVATYSPKPIAEFNLQIIGARVGGENVINVSSYGREGSLAFDNNNLYLYVGGSWKKRGIRGMSSQPNIASIPFTPTGSGDPPQAIPTLMASVPAVGYKICNWSSVLAQMTTASCSTSSAPEWNGVFDQLATTIPGDPLGPLPLPVWYFTGSSIGGNSIAADETPDWPSGDWQALDNTTRLFWFLDGKWHLEIACSNVGGSVWWVGSGDSTDINNPAGIYTTPDTYLGSFLSTLPTNIVVKAVSDTC